MILVVVPYGFTGDASILTPMTFGVDQGEKYQLFQKLVMLQDDLSKSLHWNDVKDQILTVK